jgi:PAS domain S-box-containing protein
MDLKKTQAKFADFEIDIDQGVFHKNGTQLRLRPKELSVLWLLVQQAGQLVTKEQIIKVVWNGYSTSDESIARCISVVKARMRLASAGSEQLIKTEYGRGYRFVGKVLFSREIKSTNEKSRTTISPTTLGEIASEEILTCNTETTVFEAACLLSARQKSAILILQEQKPIGIWTEADALILNLNNPAFLEAKMAEVMQTPVVSMEAEKPITDAVAIMRSKGIRHLVVVDNEGNASGVISQSDIIYTHGVESFMTVKDVNSIAFRRPFVIRDNVPVAELVLQMRHQHTDILIIDLANRPLFSFTERDLIDLIANKCLNVLIGNLDFPPLVTIKEDTSILVARQLMDIKKIKHLAVLDHSGVFIKILSLSDILADIEHSYVQLIEEILEHNKVAAENDGYTQLLASAMQQTAGMMIISDQHGDIKYVNESFEIVSGYKLDEIKDKNPRFLSSGIIPKSVFRHMWETLMSGKTWKGELCNKKKSGDKYWVLSSITPIVNDEGVIHHFIAVEEDISERKEVEIRLREIEQRFYEMIDHSLIMIWESDPNGKVSYLNDYWLKFTGRQFKDEKSNGWAEHIHHDDLNLFLETFQNALIRRNPFCIDHRLKNNAGIYRWVMNSGSPRFNEGGEFLGLRGACVDISERKTSELELKK